MARSPGSGTGPPRAIRLRPHPASSARGKGIPAGLLSRLYSARASGAGPRLSPSASTLTASQRGPCVKVSTSPGSPCGSACRRRPRAAAREPDAAVIDDPRREAPCLEKARAPQPDVDPAGFLGHEADPPDARRRRALARRARRAAAAFGRLNDASAANGVVAAGRRRAVAAAAAARRRHRSLRRLRPCRPWSSRARAGRARPLPAPIRDRRAAPASGRSRPPRRAGRRGRARRAARVRRSAQQARRRRASPSRRQRLGRRRGMGQGRSTRPARGRQPGRASSAKTAPMSCASAVRSVGR